MSEFDYKVYGNEFYQSGTVRADTYSEALEQIEHQTRYKENHFTVRITKCGN